MSPVRKFKNAKATEEAVESLHINRNTGKIAFRLVNYKYRDKDTRQMVIYFPSLELSGYGESEEKAEEMALFSIDEYFKYLIKLAPGKMDKELSVLGWKHNKIKNKEFSKAYVDLKGDLKNFNAVGDKVEEGVLTA